MGGWDYERTMPPRTLLALALGSPAPAAVHPGPSAGVLLPMAGIEGRPVGGLHNVLPGLPDVLTPIPRPMTGIPSVAGQGRRYVFRQCCRRGDVTIASGDGTGARSSTCASNRWTLARSTTETIGIAIVADTEVSTRDTPPSSRRANPKLPARIAATRAGLAVVTISDLFLRTRVHQRVTSGGNQSRGLARKG